MFRQISLNIIFWNHILNTVLIKKSELDMMVNNMGNNLRAGY